MNSELLENGAKDIKSFYPESYEQSKFRKDSKK
jgi:hypothetical protein